MNAERLHAIAKALAEEEGYTESLPLLKTLAEKLKQVNEAQANYQGNPQQITKIQQQFAEAREKLYGALTSAPSDDFSPSWRQVLNEMGGAGLFGAYLKSTIEDIFQRNQITPAVALEQLQKLAAKVEKFEDAVESLISSFQLFGIGDETLDPGKSEIGMLIPRRAVDNRLTDFADELNEMGFILNTFAEIATGKPDDLSIRTISSSDLTVFLDAGAPFAACLAVAIERTVALYKQLLEIKKLRADLLKQRVPEKQLAGIETHANELMEKGIDDLASEIVEKFYKHRDGPRKNELKNAARKALNKMANRIDRGYNIEVRVEPPQPTEGEKGQDAEMTEYVSTIQNASKQMQFLKLEGEPILQLTEGSDKEELKSKHKSKRKPDSEREDGIRPQNSSE
jgi:hypothetical protein